MSIMFGQTEVSWDDLSSVEWTEVYDENTGISQLIAKYDSTMLALNGQEVIISGYVIPLDGLGLSYALSKTSFAACFFCGQAGPETVMDLKVRPKSIPSYRQNDTKISFVGKLQLFEENPNGLHFRLEEAVEYDN